MVEMNETLPIPELEVQEALEVLSAAEEPIEGDPVEAIADTLNNDDEDIDVRELVNEFIDGADYGEDGKIVIPDTLSDMFVNTVKSELGRREAQSGYTKSRQEVAALNAENQELLNQLEANIVVDLTPEQQLELEELKLSDVDEWRDRLNTYEEEKKSQLGEKIKEAAKVGIAESQTEQNAEIVQEFYNAHPGFQLTEEIVNNELPPKFNNQLDEGVITLPQYLEQVYAYLNTDKVVDTGEKVVKQPNLNKVAGSSKPAEYAIAKDKHNIQSYNDEIY